MRKFECLLKLTPNTPSLLLKQLALFYDKVYVAPISASAIYPHVWSELQGGNPEGELVRPIDFFRDTKRMLHLPIETPASKDQKVPELIRYLKDKGIVTPIDLRADNAADSRSFGTFVETWSELTARLDVQDPQFNTLCNAGPDDYLIRSVIPVGVVSLPGDLHPIDMTIRVVPEPKPIEVSLDISESLLEAEALGAFPVFDDSLRPIIKYKYQRVRQGIEALRSVHRDSPITFNDRCKFADAVFWLSNDVFQSNLIADMDIEHLVRYRQAMEDARRKFLSNNMLELLALIESAPWTDELRREVDKYVNIKLIPQMTEFNDRSKETWDKLFGALYTASAKVVAAGLLGSLSGNVMPSVSPLQLLFLSLMAGVGAAMPDLEKKLADTIVEMRAQNRSSVAYLAKITPN